LYLRLYKLTENNDMTRTIRCIRNRMGWRNRWHKNSGEWARV